MTTTNEQSSREREAFTPFGQGTRRFTVYANPRTNIRADLEQWLANWKRNYGDEATAWLLEQAFQDFEAVIDGGLRKAVRVMAAALSRKEWAEHVSSDADATALECEITKLMGSALSGSAESGEAVAWKTTHKAVCVPITEDKEVADGWRARGWPVIDFYATPSALPAQAVGEWISVKDRLPTHNYSVIGVVVDGPFVVDDGSDDRMRDVVSYEPSRGWLQHDGNDSVVVTVTHWQDLPELP